MVTFQVLSWQKTFRALCRCLQTPPARGSSWAPSTSVTSKSASISPSLPICCSQERDGAQLVFLEQEEDCSGNTWLRGEKQEVCL